MSFIDPPEPPEGGQSLRAKDLINKVVLLRPNREATEDGKDGKPWHFVECDVWVLDRAGVAEHATEVRVSWWKVVAQLRDALGTLVGGKPVQGDDNSVTLLPLQGDARAVAEKVARELSGQTSIDDSEPF